MLERAQLKLYESILRLRPEQLGALAKAALRVKRRSVTDVNGCRFWIDPVTLLGISLLRDGSYEPQMTMLIKALLGPTDTFIDLGANEGYFSVIAASVARQGRVFAVEPQPRLRAVLLENARANAADHMSVHSLAISDRNGSAELFMRSSINQGASRLNSGFKAGFGSESVQTMTLADFCAEPRIERARLVKMDCEGAEVQIVAGSPGLFQRQAFDVIALEYHPVVIGAQGCRSIHDQLTTAGYKLAQWNGQTIYYLDSAAGALAAISNDIQLNASL